jgi:hypothetical protein
VPPLHPSCMLHVQFARICTHAWRTNGVRESVCRTRLGDSCRNFRMKFDCDSTASRYGVLLLLVMLAVPKGAALHRYDTTEVRVRETRVHWTTDVLSHEAVLACGTSLS